MEDKVEVKVEGKIEELQKELKEKKESEKREKALSEWAPKTELGKAVRNGSVKSIDEVFEKGLKILETEIVDFLLPNLEEKLVDFKKTTRVTKQGRNFSFRISVIVGDRNGHVGIGVAKDKERWPAIRKATAKAKLNIVKVLRGCSSWECTCGLQHTVPFKTVGKSSSVRITLIPAPKGIGLVVGKNIKDVLRFAGVEDVWSRSSGSTGTKLNSVRAVIDALAKTSRFRVSSEVKEKLLKKRVF